MRSFVEYLDKVKPEIDERIKAIAEEKIRDRDVVQLLVKGKRLRGGLLMLVFESHSNVGRDMALDLAAAIELAHSASLILDDMLDEDTERRGLPALHLTKGHKKAMLTAIGVLSLPYDIVAPCGEVYVKSLAETQRRMVFGVMKEIILKPNLPALKLYDLIITQKTGRLFGLAARWGVQAAGVFQKPRIDAMGEYGLHCGKAMQVADDIADLKRIIGEEKTGGFGSEMLLLRCATADRLVKEALGDIRELSPKLAKIKQLWTEEGIQSTLCNILAKEIGEAKEAAASIGVPYIDYEEILLRAPSEIADIMMKEGGYNEQTT